MAGVTKEGCIEVHCEGDGAQGAVRAMKEHNGTAEVRQSTCI